MKQLVVYARREPSTQERRFDVQVYKDKEAKEKMGRFLWWHTDIPKKGCRSLTLNCFQWKAVWLPDLETASQAHHYPAITTFEAEALLAVKAGADVYDYTIAKQLRDLWRRGLGHDQMSDKREKKDSLVTITKAMAPPKDGSKQQPYFGAMGTGFGVKVAKHTLGRK